MKILLARPKLLTFGDLLTFILKFSPSSANVGVLTCKHASPRMKVQIVDVRKGRHCLIPRDLDKTWWGGGGDHSRENFGFRDSNTFVLFAFPPSARLFTKDPLLSLKSHQESQQSAYISIVNALRSSGHT